MVSHDFHYPIGSMYGIYANIGGILMLNVTIYSIHGSYGYTYMPIPSSLREISRRQPCGLSENGWLMIMTLPMKNIAFFNEHTPISDTYIQKIIHPLEVITFVA